MSDESTRGTIKDGEYHPAANYAMLYIKSLGMEKIMIYQESFASTAIEGNRLAEICNETLHRILSKQTVSDRYIMGLAWTIKQMEETN